MLTGRLGMTNPELQQQKKLLIAVVHSIQEPWLSITKEGQFRTWLDKEYENVSIVHFYAKPANPLTKILDHLNEKLRWRSGRRIGQIRNALGMVTLLFLSRWIPRISSPKKNPFGHPSESFRVHCLDMYLTSRWKRLAVMNYFINHDAADFLLFTTSSSYVQPNLLLGKLSKLNDEILYAGPIIGDAQDSFVSGAQTVLNKKAAKLFLENRGMIPVQLLDDVGLGRTARKLNIKPKHLDTLNIDSLQKLREIDINVLKNIHHFRLKAQDGKNRRDIEIFSELHSLLSR